MTMFLKLGSIAGDSTDRAHPGWIQVETLEWGATQAVGPQPHGAGAGAGRATIEPLRYTAAASSATPPVFLACVQGTVLPEADVDVVTNGPTPRSLLKLRLRNVVVTSYDVATDDETLPRETVALTYSAIDVTYLPTRPDGRTGDPVVASWDRTHHVHP